MDPWLNPVVGNKSTRNVLCIFKHPFRVIVFHDQDLTCKKCTKHSPSVLLLSISASDSVVSDCIYLWWRVEHQSDEGFGGVIFAAAKFSDVSTKGPISDAICNLLFEIATYPSADLRPNIQAIL
jgi:hypothetical protein